MAHYLPLWQNPKRKKDLLCEIVTQISLDYGKKNLFFVKFFNFFQKARILGNLGVFLSGFSYA